MVHFVMLPCFCEYFCIIVVGAVDTTFDLDVFVVAGAISETYCSYYFQSCCYCCCCCYYLYFQCNGMFMMLLVLKVFWLFLIVLILLLLGLLAVPLLLLLLLLLLLVLLVVLLLLLLLLQLMLFKIRGSNTVEFASTCRQFHQHFMSSFSANMFSQKNSQTVIREKLKKHFCIKKLLIKHY